MSKSRKSSLSEFAGEFDEAAEEANNQAIEDACRILAAKSRGERPPEDAARRALERAKEDGQ